MTGRKFRNRLARLGLSGKRKIRSLIFNRKAISVVVSTIVLTAGVLAMGIAVMYWAFSWGNIAAQDYSKSEANSAMAAQERLGFEYINYSSSSNMLTVYIMNWGTAKSVNITNVYLWDNLHNPIGQYPNPQLLNITSGAAIGSLNIGDEGYLSISLSNQLASNSLFYIRIITGRGRTFDSSFAT